MLKRESDSFPAVPFSFIKDLLPALLTFEIEDLVQAITDRLPLLML